MADKKLEQKLRRTLKKVGYTLHKSRSAIGLDNFGGYIIVDQYNNAVVAGSRFDLSLKDVAMWVNVLHLIV